MEDIDATPEGFLPQTPCHVRTGSWSAPTGNRAPTPLRRIAKDPGDDGGGLIAPVPKRSGEWTRDCHILVLAAIFSLYVTWELAFRFWPRRRLGPECPRGGTYSRVAELVVRHPSHPRRLPGSATGASSVRVTRLPSTGPSTGPWASSRPTARASPHHFPARGVPEPAASFVQEVRARHRERQAHEGAAPASSSPWRSKVLAMKTVGEKP